MRELKLKYIIELLSNIGAQTQRDERMMTDAQRRVQRALGDTNNQVGLVERALLRMGGVGSASAERQAGYLSRLALRYHDVRQAAEGAGKAMSKVAAFAAGATAAGYAVDRMTKAPMEYSLRLAHMANTAFADRNAAGRIAGKGTLDAAINAAVRVGGGKRDDAAGALDFLIASGAVDNATAIKMLPMLMRSSTASGATPEQLANIGLRGMQSFGIGADQLPQALNMAMVAGQAGGFELKDMARWLPQAMAAGRQSGLSGMGGFQRILASMQASVITAGSKDDAGNNLVNLLGKVNSQDTANDFKKLGIDLPSELAGARSKGMNSLDAFVGFVDRLSAKDPEFAKLKLKMADAKSPEDERVTASSMADILQGKAVGKVLQDRQALMALVAEMNNRDYIKNVIGKTGANAGAMDTAFAVVNSDTATKRQAAGAALSDAQQRAFDALSPVFNKVFDGATNLGREFPVLTAAVMLAAGTIATITPAMGASGLIGMMTGAGGAGMLRTLVAGGLATAAPVAGAVAGAGFAGYELWRLGGAFSDLYQAKNREGVKLSAGSRARLGQGLPLGALGPGVPAAPDMLSLGAGGPVSLGEGRLAVDVKVSDDRTTATTSLTKPLPLVRIDAGATNPAGYTR